MLCAAQLKKRIERVDVEAVPDIAVRPINLVVHACSDRNMQRSIEPDQMRAVEHLCFRQLDFRGDKARPAANAPCANAYPAWMVTAATVNGTMRRRIIKGVSPARSSGPFVFRSKHGFRRGFLRLLGALNNPSNWATARRKATSEPDICP